jgi:tRNA pseudouridine38-40 synthase
MRNIAFRIEYDGTDFVGSQWQNNGRSVQGALEGAWEQFAQERRRFVLAGRTDAGVHALGQVANVRTEAQHDVATMKRGMNAILPEDVAVQDVWEAAFDFHARYDAVQRSYRYLIDVARVPSPLLRRHVVHVGRKLNVAAMHAAVQALCGSHDFAAFAAGTPEGSTVRTCYAARCDVVDLFGRELVAVDIAANGFLHHMVRNIVGTLLLVGEGKLDLDSWRAILASRDRRKAGRTAPAHGLYLMSVSYPHDNGKDDSNATRESMRIEE